MIETETTAAAEIAADSVSTFNLTEFVELISSGQTGKILYHLQVNFLDFMMNIFIALAVYFVGRWILRRITSLIDIAFEKRNVEVSVRSFARSFIQILFYIILVLIVVQILGINTTSFVAMFASAGLAVGMALSGTLQNFAGGVMILFLKPYKVGDYITAQGESGTVKEIMLFSTVLETVDRHTIFVPNSAISSSIIDNATFAKTRRVDWNITITYGDSVADARKAIMEILDNDKRVLADPKPVVLVSGLNDSSVGLSVRAWTKTSDYWDLFFEGNEKIYEELPKSGVRFPYPQLDVHLKKEI
ncbi:MAG: mechanosensitive ion channel [Rikenellaceae bacterium]